MKIAMILMLCIVAGGCNKTAPQESTSQRSENGDLTGNWKSKHSTLAVYANGKFRFTPVFEGDKSRGSGIWEMSRDGGYYLRYRADNPKEYRWSHAEYVRIENSDILFLYIDSEEQFQKVADSNAEQKPAPNP